MAHFKKYKILQLSYLEIDAKKCFNLLFEKFSKILKRKSKKCKFLHFLDF